MAVTWNNVREYDVDPSFYENTIDDIRHRRVSNMGLSENEHIARVVENALSTNTNATLASAANAYRNATESSIDSAGATLGSAYGRTAATNNDLLASLAALVRNGAGGGASATTGGASRYMDDAARSAAAMSGDAPTLRNYGGTMFNEGSLLFGAASPYLDAFKSLLSLDPGAGGVAGKYSELLSALDPDSLVAQYASDTQASFDNAAAQNERNLARRGVSAGSGASMGLRNQLERMKAVALAAAKTTARQAGLDRSLSAMRNAISDANSLGATGADIASRGVSAQSAGAGSVKDASGVLNAQGEIHTSLAKIANDTSSLQVQDMNARANAAQVAAGISNNTFNAARAVADSSLSAASYYAGMFNQYATLATTTGFGYERDQGRDSLTRGDRIVKNITGEVGGLAGRQARLAQWFS